MAPLTLIHANAVFLLVPLCAALTVWLTVCSGARSPSRRQECSAALLVAVSPTFLLQTVQPMSDVPVGGVLALPLLLARRPSTAAAILAGVAASLAHSRAAQSCAAVLSSRRRAPRCGPAVTAGRRHSLANRRGHAPSGAAGARLPGVVALGWIQAVRYGSPLGSGYGSFEDLFGLANIAPNLARYPRWLTETHTPFIWLWLLAPLWIRPRPRVSAFGWIRYGSRLPSSWPTCRTCTSGRDEWSYTRFLLPALPLMLVFVAFVACLSCARGAPCLARRWPPRPRLSSSSPPVAIQRVVARGVRHARRRAEVSRRRGFVRRRLPATAFVLAAQHSGSIRYYSGRPTLRWDLLDAGSLDRAIASLRRAGYEPYAVAGYRRG